MKTPLKLLVCFVFGAASTFLTCSLKAQAVNAFTKYDQTVIRHFEISDTDLNNLYDYEKIGIKTTTEKRSVNTTIDKNNDIKTTILITSSDAYEPWITRPAKIVIDKDKTTVWDTKGVVMSSLVKTNTEAEAYQKLRNEIVINGYRPLPSFKILSKADVDNLTSQGMTVSTLSNGIINIKNGDTEVNYNNSAKSYETIQYINQKVASKTSFAFAEINGQTVPTIKTEKRYYLSDKGVCIGEVTTTIYSNYERTSSLP